MNNSSARKFLFEDTQDFDNSLDDLPTITPRDHARICQEAYQNGARDAQGSLEKYALEVVSDCQKKVEELIRTEVAVVESFHRQVADLTQGILEKILPPLLAQGSFENLSQFLKETFAKLPQDRNMTIFVNPELVIKVQEYTKGFSFKGQIQVQGEPGLSKLDCRIQWQGGGLERYISDVLGKIDQELSRLSERQSTLTEQSINNNPSEQPSEPENVSKEVPHHE